MTHKWHIKDALVLLRLMLLKSISTDMKTSSHLTSFLSPSPSSQMAEKGEAECPPISSSISAQTSDSDQDPEVLNSNPAGDSTVSESNSVQDLPVYNTHLEVLDFFRQDEKEEKEAEEAAAAEEEEDDDADTLREAKRRKKNCPASLEKSLSSNRGFSFSFDTKITPIESTPKFGSFNLGLGGSDFDGIPLGLELGLGFQQHKSVEEEKIGLKSGEGGEG